MTKTRATHQVIRGGLVLDPQRRSVEPADILIADTTVADVGRPGMDAPADAHIIDSGDRLVMPGLVHAHTHSPGCLAKGSGDKWSLELLLNASPWMSRGFRLEDISTGALLNAAEMVLKGY
jgi:5-methylthioadenosine/S-adenosylhomocysteine deaminase